eukprot:291713-Chlamydomonas_euryale.AAC.2
MRGPIQSLSSENDSQTVPECDWRSGNSIHRLKGLLRYRTSKGARCYGFATGSHSFGSARGTVALAVRATAKIRTDGVKGPCRTCVKPLVV